MIIIQLMCSIIVFLCCLFMFIHKKQLRNYINELKEVIADENNKRQIFIEQHNKKIETLSFICNKTSEYVFDCGAEGFITNSAEMKQEMKENIAKGVVQYMIENNIIQIKEFDSYYKCNITFVKA